MLDQKLTIIVAFLSTVTGGLVALLTSIVMLWISHRNDSNFKEVERRNLAAMGAYAGLHRLMKTANSIQSLANHIDRQFEEARKSGHVEQDPATFIMPIIGASVVVEDLTAEETVFLLKSKDAGLMAEIWEIQQRARNNDVVVEQYNKFHMEFTEFLETHPDTILAYHGSVVSAEVKGDDAKVLSLKLGRLNTLIVPLIENLEEDRKKVREVVERYISEAQDICGKDFPVKKVDWI